MDFDEDCNAELDANFVVANGGNFVEIQATSEQHPFDREQIARLMDMVAPACQKLIELQKQVLE